MPEDIYERLQIGVVWAGPITVLSSGPIPSCVSTEAFVAYFDRYELEYCVLLWIPVRVQTTIFQLLLFLVHASGKCAESLSLVCSQYR